MRKLLTGVVILLLAAVCQAAPTVWRDPGDAWPWGAELPFPWKGIQGTWVARIEGETIYFRFVTVRSSQGFNQLQVTQHDERCRVMANGAGYETDRVVKALMVGPAGTFNLTVHVFRQSDVLKESKNGILATAPRSRTATVLNLIPLGGSGVSTRFTYQLYKVDSDPTTMFCDR